MEVHGVRPLRRWPLSRWTCRSSGTKVRIRPGARRASEAVASGENRQPSRTLFYAGKTIMKSAFWGLFSARCFGNWDMGLIQLLANPSGLVSIHL